MYHVIAVDDIFRNCALKNNLLCNIDYFMLFMFLENLTPNSGLLKRGLFIACSHTPCEPLLRYAKSIALA